MFCFGASLDSEPYLIGDMLGRKREWRWIKSANAVKGGEGAEKKK